MSVGVLKYRSVHSHWLISLFSAIQSNILHIVFPLFRPQKGPHRFMTEGRMSMTKSGSACVKCVYCV